MRAISALEIKVGLLIVIGIVAAFALMLISDRMRFDSHYQVSAYLADAGGLRKNSPVTLAGLRIGEVEQLVPVQDSRGAIRVVMRINQRHPVPAHASLTISSSGIFGDSFLAFVVHGASDKGVLPIDGSAEVLASKGFIENASQQAERILAGASDLLGPETRAEMKRLVSNAAELAAAGATLAKHLDEQNRQVSETLGSIKTLADELRNQTATLGKKADLGLDAYTRLAGSMQQQVDSLGPRTAASLERVDQLVQRGDKILTENAGDLHNTLVSLSELSARVNHIAAAIASGQGVAGRLVMDRELARDLDSAAIDLSRTASLIAEHPEALVFGSGPDEREKQRVKREREKSRRQLLAPPGGIRLDEHRDAPVVAAPPKS